MLRAAAWVTIFVVGAGLPVKSTSFPAVKVDPDQFAVVVSHVPLVAPLQVTVAAFAG